MQKILNYKKKIKKKKKKKQKRIKKKKKKKYTKDILKRFNVDKYIPSSNMIPVRKWRNEEEEI